MPYHVSKIGVRTMIRVQCMEAETVTMEIDLDSGERIIWPGFAPDVARSIACDLLAAASEAERRTEPV